MILKYSFSHFLVMYPLYTFWILIAALFWILFKFFDEMMISFYFYRDEGEDFFFGLLNESRSVFTFFLNESRLLK